MRVTYTPDFETDTAIGELKKGLSANRAVRDTLVQIVKGLVHRQHKTAYLVLINPRITVASLVEELQEFKAAMRPEIADRLHLVIVNDREIENLPADISPSDLAVLKKQIDSVAASQSPLPRADMQSEVLRVVLHQWFRGGGPMTFHWVSKTVGCTYRTVAAMIEKLGPAIERQEDRRIKLKYFPKVVWGRFLAVSTSARATVNYVDRSDQPRSPESLVRRLKELGRTDIAVGGVMGAKYHFPELNIVSAPRLDLCIHADGKHANLEFMEQLDPALAPANASDVRARVALHFVRRRKPLFSLDEHGNVWADPVECLADLFEANLDDQASELQSYMTERGERLSGRG